MRAVLLMTTVSRLAHADHLATKLVHKRLAACVTVLPRATSYYRWKKSLQKSKEYVLLIKTQTSLWTAVSRYLQKAHPYEVPEILELPAGRVAKSYLKWLAAETSAA
jgi:periplasmic divalent cation tolerance protein